MIDLGKHFIKQGTYKDKNVNEETPEIKEVFQKIEQFEKKIMAINQHFRPILEGEIYLQGKEVCDILHISKRTLQQYRDDDILPYVQLNGKSILESNIQIMNLLME